MKEIYSMNSMEIDSKFREYILQGYPDFKFNYNWANYDFVEIYLKRLMLKSMAVNCHDALLLKNLEIYIHDIEEFFVTGISTGILNDNNFLNVVATLNKNVRSIGHLPLEYSGCYGRSVETGIEINSHFSKHPNSPDLSSDDIRRMYIFHELGHNIVNLTNDTFIIEYCDKFRNVLHEKGEYSIYELSREMVYAGFWLLEEALVQELAETLAYSCVGKTRPMYRIEEDLGVKYYTNFDYYGLFQNVAMLLGNTMRGIGEYPDDPYILRGMLERVLKGNFVEELVAEYSDGNAGLYHDLGIVLQNMGNVLNEKYGTFTKKPFESNAISALSSYKSIKKLCDKNMDFREYPENGFGHDTFNR